MKSIQKLVAIAALIVPCTLANQQEAVVASSGQEVSGVNAAILQARRGLEAESSLKFNNEMELEEWEADLFKREKQLMKEQADINEKWMKYLKHEQELLKNAKHDVSKQMEKLTLKQKLAGISDSLGKNDFVKEIWGDKAGDIVPKNIVLKFDTVNNIVGVQSEDVDAKGRPVLEWEMNKNSGHITETKRAKDGSEV